MGKPPRDCVTRADLEDLERRLVRLIEERLSGKPADPDVPPMPPIAEGKKFKGEKRDIRAIVDRNLKKRLDTYARAYFAGNVSRSLDVILWNFFDKPRLSFEETGDEEITFAIDPEREE